MGFKHYKFERKYKDYETVYVMSLKLRRHDLVNQCVLKSTMVEFFHIYLLTLSKYSLKTTKIYLIISLFELLYFCDDMAKDLMDAHHHYKVSQYTYLYV